MFSKDYSGITDCVDIDGTSYRTTDCLHVLNYGTNWSPHTISLPPCRKVIANWKILCKDGLILDQSLVTDFRKSIFENGSSMIKEIYFRSEEERPVKTKTEEKIAGRKGFYDRILEWEKKLDSVVVFAFCDRALQEKVFLPFSYLVVCMREFMIYVRRHVQKSETAKSLDSFKLLLRNFWRSLLGTSVHSHLLTVQKTQTLLSILTDVPRFDIFSKIFLR
jgi:hypothetical protein